MRSEDLTEMLRTLEKRTRSEDGLDLRVNIRRGVLTAALDVRVDPGALVTEAKGTGSDLLEALENLSESVGRLVGIRETTPLEVLRTPMRENDAEASTIGEYLVELSEQAWIQAEGFSGKRPFGNSDWEHEIWDAIYDAGYCDRGDQSAANDLVQEAFEALREYVKPQTTEKE